MKGNIKILGIVLSAVVFLSLGCGCIGETTPLGKVITTPTPTPTPTVTPTPIPEPITYISQVVEVLDSEDVKDIVGVTTGDVRIIPKMLVEMDTDFSKEEEFIDSLLSVEETYKLEEVFSTYEIDQLEMKFGTSLHNIDREFTEEELNKIVANFKA